MVSRPAIYPLANSIALTKFHDPQMDCMATGFTVMACFLFSHRVCSGIFDGKHRKTKDGNWISWLRIPIDNLPPDNPIRERFEERLDRLYVAGVKE